LKYNLKNMLPKIIFHVKLIMNNCYHMTNLMTVGANDFTKNE
jgi:hypothetical protein